MRLDRVIAVRNSKTVYRDGDKCIKVFNSEYSKSDVLNEALNQARAETLSVNVPRICEVVQTDGKWAIVSDYIKGKTLARLIEEEPGNKNKYLEFFVELQIKLQSNKTGFFERLKSKTARKISKAELDRDIRQALESKLNEIPDGNSVCHGDFFPSNIIVSDDGEAYIIDWSHVTRGDASLDAARSYLLFWLHGDISGAEKYLELYCEKSGISEETVKSGMSVVAAAQMPQSNAQQRGFLISRITDPLT